MSSSFERDGAISAQGSHDRGGRTLWIVAAIVLVVCAAFGALYWLSQGGAGGGGGSKSAANNARTYRTIAKTELRAEANQAAKLVVTLREGTTVSGVPAGNQDGVEWLEITAVDGTKGFVPKTQLKELGPSATGSEIRGGTRRIVTSATVNLRETPSMSGKILGVAEGGTRLVSDGSLMSEGEEWLRVPLDGQTTVFIIQRFTMADDDGGGSDGIEGDPNAALGVRGFATQIANVQATPMADARIVRALQLGEEVRIIGQTNAGRAWYVLRLADGSQGFAPREALRLDPNASRWVYPDGTLAPGPNIPKGSTVPVVSGSRSNAPATGANTRRRQSQQSGGGAARGNDAGSNNAGPTPVPVPVPVEAPAANPTPAASTPQPEPVPGPQ